MHHALFDRASCERQPIVRVLRCVLRAVARVTSSCAARAMRVALRLGGRVDDERRATQRMLGTASTSIETLQQQRARRADALQQPA